MKKLATAICLMLLITTNNFAQKKKDNTFKQNSESLSAAPTASKTKASMKNIYDFKVKDIDGKVFDFATLKGKKVMIVNTASKCGLTPQYAELQKLYMQYKDANFVIIGFPANNFAAQEPGTNQEIHSFCQKNYGVTFPMMEKISVVGDDMADIYKYLTSAELNGLQDSEVAWNFQKYLINEKGQLEKVVQPKTTPMSPEIVNWITKK